MMDSIGEGFQNMFTGTPQTQSIDPATGNTITNPAQASTASQVMSGLGQAGNLYAQIKNQQMNEEKMKMYKEDRAYKKKREKELSDGARALGNELAR